MMQTIEQRFQLEARGSTVGRELRGAAATFLTMSYILVANPAILAAAGVPFAPAVACTAAAAGICSILMGIGANFPIALAPGMGLNALIAYQIAAQAGSWEKAMGLVFWDGAVILVLVLLGLREAMLEAIPVDLRRAIGGGIGLFIALIGAVNARMVVVPPSTVTVLSKSPAAPMPPVAFGSLSAPETAVAAAGLCVTAWLLARKTQGGIVLGILFSTVLAWLAGLGKLPDAFGPPSFEVAFKADVLGVLRFDLVPVLIAVLLVDFFDTLGTVTAISEGAKLHDEKGRIPGVRNVLLVDSVSASIGGLFGVSSVTSYIESAAGVAEGARTGLHSVFVGLMFLAAILAAPLAVLIPPAATAPALILVGFLMTAPIARIDFEEMDTAIPAFVTLVMLPFTYSITHGIGYGFITFVAIKTLERKFGDVHPLMYGAAAIFAAYFVLGS